ncbi:hypothetical protein PFISCL1PPCAC_21258, partial [Pristionchus fissidentatus]
SMTEKTKDSQITGREGEEKESFPILDLPGEISSKILSCLGKQELAICLQSLTLDKINAEWNKKRNNENITILVLDKNVRILSSRYYFDGFCSPRTLSNRMLTVFTKLEIGELTIRISEMCKEYLFRVIIEHCAEIKCKDILTVESCINSSTNVLTDKLLLDLSTNKKDVNIKMFCERITAAGLFAVWEYLLDGKFDGISIIVSKSVVIKLFNMIRTDGMKSWWDNEHMFHNMCPIRASGRKNSLDKCEIRCATVNGERSSIRMDRIYSGRIWSRNYN